MTEFWFARRYPVGNPRSGLAPVHWKGWAVAGVFAAAMLIGAVSFIWMSVQGYAVQGAVVFALAALVGGGWFVIVADRKADKARTVAEYREMSTRV